MIQHDFFVTYHYKKITALSRYARTIFPTFAAECTDSVNVNFQQHTFSIKSKIIQKKTSNDENCVVLLTLCKGVKDFCQ